MSRCDLTDLEVTACAHCRGLSLDTAGPVKIVHRFPAHFDSGCDNCEGRIREGDVIGRTDEGEYVCERCCA